MDSKKMLAVDPAARHIPDNQNHGGEEEKYRLWCGMIDGGRAVIPFFCVFAD